MKIAVGSDHRGFRVKVRIAKYLAENHHEVVDCGAHSDDAVDYPEFAAKVTREIADGAVERGILICGTGIGMCIAANKQAGIRATTVHDDVTAELSRRHNDSNVLCLAADLLGERLIDHIVEIWLKTPFDGGRHQRRLKSIEELEKRV